MKIAHISDLHICSKFKRNNIAKTKKLLKHALDSGTDHIVITGDISDNAQEQDFFIFRKILQSFGLLSAERTSVVIGNHDIFGGAQTAQDVINFTSKCINTNYHQKVENFVKYFEELFENTFLPNKEERFPFAKEINDIVLIGINSIEEYSKLKNPFASNGYVSKNQMSGLEKIFSAKCFVDKIKIVLIHHHFYKNDFQAKSSESALWKRIESFTMKLRKKKKLFKMFNENNVGLVLHGHSHELKEYYRKTIKFLNAGGSVENDSKNEAGIFFVHINGSQIDVNLNLINTNGNGHKKILENSFAVQSVNY
jgi:3',5'-cyclic AMP phosphodiesterase CpdA